MIRKEPWHDRRQMWIKAGGVGGHIYAERRQWCLFFSAPSQPLELGKGNILFPGNQRSLSSPPEDAWVWSLLRTFPRRLVSKEEACLLRQYIKCVLSSGMRQKFYGPGSVNPGRRRDPSSAGGNVLLPCGLSAKGESYFARATVRGSR